MQIFCLTKCHLSFGEKERRHLLLVPGLKRVGFCSVSFIYILGHFWVIRIFSSLSVIYEDKRELTTVLFLMPWVSLTSLPSFPHLQSLLMLVLIALSRSNKEEISISYS